MARSPVLKFAMVALLGITSIAVNAQSRCDCDQIVGSCRAQVTEMPKNGPGARFKIEANTSSCSIVEWSVDGDRGMTTIQDGGENVDRVSPRKPGGMIKVHSCRVCKDSLISARGDRPSNTSAGLDACRALEFTSKELGPIKAETIRDMMESNQRGRSAAAFVEFYRFFHSNYVVDEAKERARERALHSDKLATLSGTEKVEFEKWISKQEDERVAMWRTRFATARIEEGQFQKVAQCVERNR